MALPADKNVVINWLSKYWFLFTALVAVSVAWGDTVTKVRTIEDAVKQQAQTQAEVAEMKATQARLDERTLALQKGQEKAEASQARIESILMEMARTQQSQQKSIKRK